MKNEIAEVEASKTERLSVYIKERDELLAEQDKLELSIQDLEKTSNELSEALNELSKESQKVVSKQRNEMEQLERSKNDKLSDV